MVKYVIIAVVSGVLSSFSQVLLKKSAQKKRQTVLKEYFNFHVIFGYAITLFCMLLTIIAYRGIPFKYGAVLESLVYLYIMILSRVFLNENFTKKKIIGNIIIVIGVIVFSLGK